MYANSSFFGFHSVSLGVVLGFCKSVILFILAHAILSRATSVHSQPNINEPAQIEKGPQWQDRCWPLVLALKFWALVITPTAEGQQVGAPRMVGLSFGLIAYSHDYCD
jgi:hypothetical protein